MPNPPTTEDNNDYTQEIRDPSEFTLSWSGWGSETNAEKRRVIAQKLKDYNFAVNPVKISLADFKAIVGIKLIGDGTDEFETDGYMEGIYMVNAHVDGTSDTGTIQQGQSVVFDTTTGRCVTGINEDWETDEYKIVGTSLVDFEYSSGDPDEKAIPIRMTPPGVAATESKPILARCVYKRYPRTSLSQWLQQGLQRVVWEFEIMSKDIEVTNPNDTGSLSMFPLRPKLSEGFDNDWASDTPPSGAESGEVVEVFNIARQFIPIGQVAILTKRGEAYYCDVKMEPIIWGNLDEMLDGTLATYPTGTPGKMTTSACNGLDNPIDIWDYGEMMPGAKLGPGTNVLAGLIRTGQGAWNIQTPHTDDPMGGTNADDGFGELNLLWSQILWSNSWANTSYIYTIMSVSACPTPVVSGP